MKPAEGVLKELVLHVRPPRDRAIVLTEWNSSGPTDPNWIAAWERRSSSAIVIKSPICVKQTQKSTGLTSRLLLVSTGWLFGFRRSIAATRRVRSQARRGECSTRSAPNTCPVEGRHFKMGTNCLPARAGRTRALAGRHVRGWWRRADPRCHADERQNPDRIGIEVPPSAGAQNVSIATPTAACLAFRSHHWTSRGAQFR